MSSQLLVTKLYIPRSQPNLVLRPRLLERLEAGAIGPATVVCTPTGYGKTTLVSEWVHQGQRPATWLSLDGGDNDTSRFWSYFIAALQTLGAGTGESALALLQSTQPPSHEAILTTSINEITSFSEDFALVLDDYHVINVQTIHSAISFLIEHLPPHMHLVIISRLDPPLPLARLWARGQLAEIREADLRFTSAEAANFLNGMMGLAVSDESISALESRTEGWIAALQMAALSMRGREDVEEFTGSHRYILDYLAEEVLDHQPEEIRTFLLQTSILDRLTGPLCDSVTGLTNSQAILDRLDSGGLFTLPLDEQRHWYRYHHLFSDFLYINLRERQGARIPEFHLRASQWYEDQGLLTEAIGHALDAEDFLRAVDLVEQASEGTLWRDGQATTLLNWIDSLPEDLVLSRPELCLFQAWGRFTTGQWEAVDPLLEAVELSIGDDQDAAESDRMIGEVGAIRSGISYESGEMERSIELARQALSLLPKGNLTLMGVVTFNLGLGYFFSGDVPRARQTYANASAICHAVGNQTVELLAVGCLAQLEVRQGNLRKAAEHYQHARDLGPIGAGPPLPTMGLACVQIGEVLRERNQLEAAQDILSEGIELCKQQGGMPECVLEGCTTLARVYLAQGNVAGSKDAMDQGAQILSELLSRSGGVYSIVSRALGYQVRLNLARGNVAGVAQWKEDSGLRLDGEIEPFRQDDYILMVRILRAHGRADQVTNLLGRLLGIDTGERPSATMELLILNALDLLLRQDQTKAADTLQRALALAEPEGYVRLFLDEGQSMVRMLRDLASRSPTGYASQLLAASISDDAVAMIDVSSSPSRRVASHGSEALLEPMNDRELDVLRLVASGLSNREISGELFISANTVKWYTRNIFGKLRVHKRAEAVARAHKLGLL